MRILSHYILFLQLFEKSLNFDAFFNPWIVYLYHYFWITVCMITTVAKKKVLHYLIFLLLLIGFRWKEKVGRKWWLLPFCSENIERKAYHTITSEALLCDSVGNNEWHANAITTTYQSTCCSCILSHTIWYTVRVWENEDGYQGNHPRRFNQFLF